MLTRRQAVAEIAKLQAQLAVHQHETRKNLQARVARLASEKKELEQKLKIEQENRIAAEKAYMSQRKELALLREHLTEDQLALVAAAMEA